MKKAILDRLARSDFARKAIADRADLRAFRQRPTPRIVAGFFAIGLSYLIGWPAIGALGALSVHLNKPAIVAVGGPLTYGLSHLVFILGMYLAGADFTKIFLRWVARVVVEKHQGPNGGRASRSV